MRRADLIHQTLDVGAGDAVVGEHAGEDLDRSLELFRDHDIRAQPTELRDFRHVAGASDDVDAGVEAARHAHHAASGRRVRDCDDEHSGALRPEGAQDLFARGIAVEGRLAAGPGLLYGLRIELDDEVRCPDRPQRRREVPPIQAVPGDDHVVGERLLRDRDRTGAESRQEAVQRDESLQPVEQHRAALQQERRHQHGEDGYREERLVEALREQPGPAALARQHE